MNTFIWTTFRVEGIHYWKDAQNYLRHPHRHLFCFKVKCSVSHDDREIEFIAFKKALAHFVEGLLQGEVQMSCEHIAKAIIEYLVVNYGNRVYVVDVSEDGENGAEVKRSKK